MKNKLHNRIGPMHPFTLEKKKRVYKPKLHDFIYLLLSILIIVGFSDNVERFVSSTITPKVVQAQTRIEKARRILFNEEIVSPLSLIKEAQAEEVKNPFNIKSPKGIAWELNKKEFGVEHWGALEELITHESGWNPFVMNEIGACGLGQALPCVKMTCENWDYECQVKWTLDYIKDRYENPTKAWNHWQARVPIDGKDVGNWY